MIKQLLVNNLKGIKRQLKEVPEFYRAAQAWFIDGKVTEMPEKVGDELSFKIRVYDETLSLFPVDVVTPPGEHYMTTFFDVNPISPDGDRLCVTKVPFIKRIPIPGDLASVCVINLNAGSCKTVYQTVGWGAQLGANVQWLDDETVVCNDVIDGVARGVRVNTLTLKYKVLDGPIYGLDVDKRFSYSGNLEMVNAIIPGYGVPDPIFGKTRQVDKISSTEGIWKTDLENGESKLFLSMEHIVSKLPMQKSVKGGTYYIFNTKVSADGAKIFSVLFSRNIPLRAGWAVQLVTMDIDGSNVKLAMPDKLWCKGGHHPNWCSSNGDLIMNLKLDGKNMEFVKFDASGENVRSIANGLKGSGHPSISPDGRYLLTDAYVKDGFTDESGLVPIRLIDLKDDNEIEICRIFTNKLDGPRRVDPHPVWIDGGKKVAFNAVIDGFRQVLIADLSRLY